MIESAAYDIIKQEGIQEGIQEGMRKGKMEGLKEGKASGIRESLAILIESQFGEETVRIRERLDSISDSDRLLELFRVIHQARDADELLARIDAEIQ